MANRIWIDVEDLFVYARPGLRPSGIQRLEFELCRAIAALPQSQGRVFFVRHDAGRQCLVATPWEDVEAIFDVMNSESREGETAPKRSSKTLGGEIPAAVRTIALSALRKAVQSLPARLRKIIAAQIEVFIAVAELMRALAVSGARALPRRRNGAAATSPASTAASRETTDYFAAMARPGDILAVLGAAWITRDFAFYVEKAILRGGLRLALLVYDIIPLRRSEWFNETVIQPVQAWFAGALPLADAILTISAATARDVAEYARSADLALRAAPIPIPIGSGFKSSTSQRSPSRVASRRLPPPNSYALIVSTIEVRKNHALLFQVWRRLLVDLPAESVPTLVFAGRIGWLVSDLMEQLHNSRFLNGKIVHIDSPTDEELAALYDGCLFTLYPSFYEGWGLPVTESLAFGRPCIVSNATSLPEAGGSLARYIDPDNITDAYRVIRETIEDQAGLRSWRDHVRCEFKPVEWSQSARAVLKLLDTIDDVSCQAKARHCA